MENYIIVEIEDENENYFLALPSNINQITKNVYKDIKIEKNKDTSFTFYKNNIYPIFSIPELKNPNLNFFLIYSSFAFAVTRIFEYFKPEKVHDVENEIKNKLPFLEKIIGSIYWKGNYIYIFNLEKAVPVRSKFLNEYKEEDKREKKESNNYVLIDNKYVVKIDKIENMRDSDYMINFKSGNYIGFINFEEDIIPIIPITDDGDKIIIINKKGYLYNKILPVRGKEIKDKNENKYLNVENKKYQILG